jgi:hypothetical protein
VAAPAAETDPSVRGPTSRAEQVRRDLVRDSETIDRIRRFCGVNIAIGRLLDDAGGQLISRLPAGGSKGAEGLADRYRSMKFAHHVEATVTAIMRQRGIRHTILYLNKPPCEGDESCRENLEATLPVGYRLTVRHVGRASVNTYEFYGNGEGLKP